MTANQIAYWKNVETERSNRANEELTSRQRDIDSRKADISEKEMLERVRHNQVTESLDKQENTRKNYQMVAKSIYDTIQGIYGFQDHNMDLVNSIMSIIGSASGKKK